SRRRAEHHRPSRQGLRAGQGAGGEAARGHPPPDVRGGDPGRHRQPGHRPRDGQGDGQERHCQVLRRRHHAQAQAAGAPEGRQEAHEAGRPRRGTAGGVPVGTQELTPVDPEPKTPAQPNVRFDYDRAGLSVGPEAPPAPVAEPESAALPEARRRKSVTREYAEAIIIAILLALVIRTLIVQAFTIPSGSMMDTLLVGDYILVNKFLFGPEVPFTE